MTVDVILVAVDGSANGRRALEWATALAARLDAEVLAVHALGLLDHDAHRAVPALPRREQIRDCFEREWCAPLDAEGVRSRRLLVDGSPAAVVLRIAEEEDVDLIVVGSRGHAAVPARLLGSTSTAVVQESTRPVVVIPPQP